jgi:hypothetical protein
MSTLGSALKICKKKKAYLDEKEVYLRRTEQMIIIRQS